MDGAMLGRNFDVVKASPICSFYSHGSWLWSIDPLLGVHCMEFWVGIVKQIVAVPIDGKMDTNRRIG